MNNIIYLKGSKMLFEFKIYNKEIIKIEKAYIVNVNKYNKCKFYFDKETYQDKELFVTFIDKNGYSQTVILGKWAETLSCNIPKHMVNSEYFKIFCYTKEMFKTNTLTVYNKKKCKPLKKHNDAIEFLMGQLQTKIDNITFEDNQLKCYSNNNLVDTIYIDNVDEAIIKDIVKADLTDFEAKINEKLEDFINDDDLDYLIVSL